MFPVKGQFYLYNFLRAGFMHKSQIIRGLLAAVNKKVVMRFIVSCKVMARGLLFLCHTSLRKSFP